jgi:transcriptional regulator with XRE-family HTH domain
VEVDPVDARLGARLAALRAERGWSLGEVAERSGVSKSTLFRAERAETSPTAALLNRLCGVYGRTMSQLLSEVESEPALLVRAAEQQVWADRASGFVRRSVSPPHPGLRGELVEGRLAAGADIAYDRPPVPGLEQHLWVLEGELEVTAQDAQHHLEAEDCLRLRVWGPTRFRCTGPGEARYVLAVVLP